MVSAAFAKKGPPPPKEEVDWRVLSIVGFAIVHSGLSSAGNAPAQTPLSGLRLITMA